MILCSKLKNGLCFSFTFIGRTNINRIQNSHIKLNHLSSSLVTKSQVVTKFNVTKSRLHCMYVLALCMTKVGIEGNSAWNS